jgi:prephenate dehydratase
VGQALQAVRSGEIAAALVPIENSVEGGVSATLDNLTYGDPLVITREVLLPVQFDLYGRPGSTLDGVRNILTHPHAARAVPRLARPARARGRGH